MADNTIALGAKTANFMLPSEALENGQRLKALQNNNAMAGMEMQDKQNLDRAYRESGGDINAMLKNPNLGFEAGTKLQQLSSENVKAQNAEKLGKLDFMIKGAEYSGRLARSAKNQQDWDKVRQHAIETLGEQAATTFPAEFSEAARNQVIEGSMSFKDQMELQRMDLQMQREDRMAGQQDRMYQLALNRDGRAAAGGSDGGGKVQYDSSRGGYFDPSTRQFVALTGAGGAPLPAKSGKSGGGNLSATAQKELFEAEDMVMAGDNVKSAIDSALALNDKAYSGYGAGERATIRSNLPGQSEGADATVQMNNIILGQALESLKATFGGAPTEGERAILVQLQASVDKTPQQRKAILEKARELADKRVKFNKTKASQLRSGEYLSEGGGSSSVESSATADHSNLWN